MYANDEITVERAQAYLDALEREQEGYEVRLSRLKDGKQDPADAKTLDGRVVAVKTEIKRVKRQLSDAKKQQDGDESAAEEEAGE